MSDVMRQEYRPLSTVERSQMDEIKARGLQLYDFVESLGASRESSIAKTKIEEAVMWATKHLTR